MWSAEKTSLQWNGEGNTLSFFVFQPYYHLFPGEIVSLQKQEIEKLGYDDWVQSFSREEEINLVKSTIISLQHNPRRVHIAGLSCAESVDLLTEYYSSLGYEDVIAHNYTLTRGILLTASITLRHLLWCEKDKNFLKKNDTQGQPYYVLVPPLRSPRDLRVLQQAVRMGVIPCVEVGYDVSFLGQILERQILTPFQLAQCIGFYWKEYGFSGDEEKSTLTLPQFPWDTENDIFL